MNLSHLLFAKYHNLTLFISLQIRRFIAAEHCEIKQRFLIFTCIIFEVWHTCTATRWLTTARRHESSVFS